MQLGKPLDSGMSSVAVRLRFTAESLYTTTRVVGSR